MDVDISHRGKGIIMLLKEYATWPPEISGDLPTFPQETDLNDVVSAVRNVGKGQVGLVVRKQHGVEITFVLPVPAYLQQKIMLDIVRKRNITVREVGDLPIS